MKPAHQIVCRSLTGFLLALSVLAWLPSTRGVAGQQPSSQRPAYLDPNQPIDARIEDLLARMTLAEKIALVHADNRFSTAGVPRLGIPARQLSDGPHGVREETVGRDVSQAVGRTDDFATYLPALVGLAATWNPDLAGDYGKTIGAEVAQVYVRDVKPTLPRPLKELKGFRKVWLKPGERQTISIPLERGAFAFYDPQRRGWVAERGDFRIMVGSSSRDLRLEGNYTLARTTVEE
jgi:hypothetical protein